mgnify:CR=1 FL=1
MSENSPRSETTPQVTPPDSVVLRRRGLSVLFPRRSTVAALLLGVLAALAVVGSTMVGVTLTPGQALGALLGNGSPGAEFLVWEFRLPRIVAGLVAGAALGLAGCLSQTLARNRLATPDVLGVNDGATTVVLISLLAGTSGTFGAWWAGPLGAVLTALLVLLAAGGLGTHGYRVVVVGLAVSTMISALTDLVLSAQSLETASAVHTWTIGTLNGRGLPGAVPVAVGLAFLLPAALLAARQLTLFRLDEDVAATLGVNVRVVKLGVLSIAVLLAGLAVGLAGAVSFVAMAAPIVAGRLCGPTRIPVFGSALTGALLVIVADTVGRVAAPPGEVPVGVITSVIGGPFLLWVLLTDGRRRTD